MLYEMGDKVLDEWVITRTIGEGSYGKVVEIERNEFGLSMKSALKIISIPGNNSELKAVMGEGVDNKSITSYFYGFVEEIIKEIAIMSELKGHTNIVTYEDHRVIPHQDHIGWDILIRMELLTSLLDYSEEHEITEQTVIKLGTDILTALEVCQKYHVVHRDIKPENIFVSATGDLKLGDFGIARTIEKTTFGMSKKGTYPYMAPEIYQGKESDILVDMYSLGLVMYRMLNDNHLPFSRIPEKGNLCRQKKYVISSDTGRHFETSSWKQRAWKYCDEVLSVSKRRQIWQYFSNERSIRAFKWQYQ